MERLREYIKTLTAHELDEYAARCGTTAGYLRKAIYAKPRLDGALCRRLDEQSNGAVPRASLRPDIWPDDPPKYEIKGVLNGHRAAFVAP